MNVASYRYYSDAQLKIESIDSKLSAKEKIVRRYLLDSLIKNKQHFSVTNLSKIAEDIKTIKKEELDKILDNLLMKNIIVADEDNNVNFIYPVSAIPTNHKVKLADGREFSAMCAIDAIGCAFTFKQDVDIESKCSNCSANIKVSVKDEKLSSYDPIDLHILHVDLNKNTNWSGNC